MPTASEILGKFASELQFSAIPPAVVERAKDCIIDAIAAGRFGAQFPWSRMAVDYARRYGNGGPCTIVGTDARVQAPFAALANGVQVHAFELDSARYPNVGAHPGATIVPAVLAACEDCGADGKTALTAFVAGCEIVFRIGASSHHSPEKRGFHAPNLSGTYGAAAAVGRVYGYSAEQLTNALGIAGSLSSGILAFSKSKQGGMVKRLHLGRAAESGILAAQLAGSGYQGPETVLDGKFGYLDVYCNSDDVEPVLLTKGLREDWETLRVKLKPYASSGFTHTPMQSTRDLMAEHGFQGSDVAHVVVEGTERLASHHNILEPRDIMQAQYSVPFCVALALYRNPEDPNSFVKNALDDPQIRAACREIIEIARMPDNANLNYTSRVRIRLKDGREFERRTDTIKGHPSNPFSRAELRQKFMYSAGDDETGAAKILEKLETLEAQPRFSAAGT